MADVPVSLKRKISPPPPRSTRRAACPNKTSNELTADPSPEGPSPAAVEAGQADIRDHLDYFTAELAKARRERYLERLSLPIPEYRDLYARNQGKHGRHFVIHQHDHPVAGVHYDLRLQVSPSSSISFSIPYGLPGNPNSLRPNRMAIETRVHNLWNNLIESASHSTGSLLIWDTGEYEIMPRPIKHQIQVTDDEDSSDEAIAVQASSLTEAQKLKEAFHTRHMHIRLHGTRLPHGYTIAMRLPKQNMRHRQPGAPKRRRRRIVSVPVTEPSTSDSDTDLPGEASADNAGDERAALQDAAVASDDESRDARERETIRQNNAYPGATNDIGSIHQRQWFLSLDREHSGFVKSRRGSDKADWVCKTDGLDGAPRGFAKFYVMGRDVERSVVTGRSAMEVMDDAGVKGYIGRKMWRPITE